MMRPGVRLNDVWRTLRAVDVFCVFYLLVTAALAVLAACRVPRWPAIVAMDLSGAVLVVLFRRVSLDLRARWGRLVFGAFPLALFAWLWAQSGMLQHILHAGWYDGVVIRIEHAVFGVDLSLWADRFASKPVTEWMMFGYFGYLPLISAVAAVLFLRISPRAMDTYLFALGLAFTACYAGFILLPVAGPQYVFDGRYTHELDGYVFTYLASLMAKYGHYPGGCFPSPHSAAGTVMLFMTFKHHRPTFCAILPVIGTFYLATVYGRYHYVSDTVTGIVLGLIVGWAAPKIEAAWRKVAAPGSLGTPVGQ